MRASRLTTLMGPALALEGFRRTFIGGTFLSMFIIKEFGLSPNAQRTLDLLTGYLDIEEQLIGQIHAPFKYLIGPWQDHNASGRVVSRILQDLVTHQFPPSCTYYWQEPAPQAPPTTTPSA